MLGCILVTPPTNSDRPTPTELSSSKVRLNENLDVGFESANVLISLGNAIYLFRANCHQGWTRRLRSGCWTDGHFPLQCRCGLVAQLDDRVAARRSIDRFRAGAAVRPIAGLVADHHQDDRAGHWRLHMPCQNYPRLGRRQGHSHRSRYKKAPLPYTMR